jgi:tRNA pseudouridine38-40 synthase
VHGAGRTDAGVHALGQCAHAEVPSRSMRPAQWTAALNTSLPPTIRVMRCSYAAPTFHARFSAVGKVYRYRIWNGAILPPLEHGRAWHVPTKLDVAAMRREAEAFVGRHDFAAFAANRGRPEHDTVRTIASADLKNRGSHIALEFSGDGFLYKMVRLMVGALVRRGRGQAADGEIGRRLRSGEPSTPAERFVAPAEGLYLVRVRY